MFPNKTIPKPNQSKRKFLVFSLFLVIAFLFGCFCVYQNCPYKIEYSMVFKSNKTFSVVKHQLHQTYLKRKKTEKGVMLLLLFLVTNTPSGQRALRVRFLLLYVNRWQYCLNYWKLTVSPCSVATSCFINHCCCCHYSVQWLVFLSAIFIGTLMRVLVQCLDFGQVFKSAQKCAWHEHIYRTKRTMHETTSITNINNVVLVYFIQGERE